MPFQVIVIFDHQSPHRTLDLTMILRLSQKINTKIKAGPLPEMPLNDNPYADWSCHLFKANRTQYIIITNTKSLYSFIMPQKGITNESKFIDSVLSSMQEFMTEDGQAFAFHRFIAPACDTVSFAKALDRRVTGSMTQLISEAKIHLEDFRISPFNVGYRLNSSLFSAIATEENFGYGMPIDAFKQLGGFKDSSDSNDDSSK